MITSIIGVAAAVALVILFGVMPFLGRAWVVGAVVGTVVGFLIGIIVHVAIGLMHWFGPVDVPDPVIQIGNVATTISMVYPVVLGAVGFVVGLTVARRRQRRPGNEERDGGADWAGH